jgi:hypothetical protein
VTIAGGRTVTVDRDARARSVHVADGGTLAFAEDRSATLELHGNLVVEGTLEMVAPDPKVHQTVRFVGIDEGAVRGGGHEVLDSDVGLWAHHHGRLDIRGAAKTSWTRTTGARAGDRRLTLEAPPVGWQAGDELVVVPSLPPTSDNFSEAFDQARLRSVSGAQVTLDGPLTYDHPSAGGFHPEVLNLTRNVRIGGTPDGHAHLMSMACPASRAATASTSTRPATAAGAPRWSARSSATPATTPSSPTPATASSSARPSATTPKATPTGGTRVRTRTMSSTTGRWPPG